jgi:hypothetical protein
MKVPAPSLFDKIDPGDGYIATSSAIKEGLRVSVELISLGETLRHADVYENNNPRNLDIGVQSRLYAVMEAVCRYFNCGGSWDELEQALGQTKTVILGGLEFTGWVFLDSIEHEDGIIFRWVEDATGRVANWVVGEYIDTDCGSFGNIDSGGGDGDLVHVQPAGDDRDP